MRLIPFVITIALFIFTAPFAYAQDVSPKLSELEQAAKKRLDEDKPQDAIGIYHQYAYQMVEEGWAALQPDLLTNLAIANYRAGNLGAAMANLKQLSILKDSPKVDDEIKDLQMLIEHRAYQNAPNTAFVRGQSRDYLLWESVHRFSRSQLNMAVIFVWSLLFISLGAFLIIPALKKSRVIFGILISTWMIFVICMGIFTLQHRMTDDQIYGVLMQTSSLRHEPGYEAAPVEDPAFVPGMTVSVISSVEGWIKVERMDGVTCWMDVNDFYLLRGVGDQRSSRLQN